MDIQMISDLEYTVKGIRVPNWNNQKYCVFDLEATGIEQDTAHITQIGAVIIENGGVISKNTFNTFVKPPKPIPEPVEQFTGIYNAQLKHAPSFKDAYPDFRVFAQDCILVTHAGYEYDLPLLRHECARTEADMITNLCLDTKALFTYLYPDVRDIISTDVLIRYYSIDDQDLRRHDALADSLLIARIFTRMMQDYGERRIKDLVFDDPVTVKRFQIKPLC